MLVSLYASLIMTLFSDSSHPVLEQQREPWSVVNLEQGERTRAGDLSPAPTVSTDWELSLLHQNLM